MFMRSIAMAALALCLATGPSGAVSESCTSRVAVAAFIDKEFPEARVIVFDGNDAKAILASLAAATGATPPASDEVMVIDLHPKLPIVKVAVFRMGCLAGAGNFQRRVVTTAINAVARAGA